jgi:hypothetical protein
MDIFGTKTPSQLEDEEAERLVRGLPKKKPPRHDRRRERMENDKDPDLDEDKDPDMSLNYKSIGGSVNLLRVVRLAAGPTDKVKVRRKEDGKIVDVSKDTLHDRGSDYEKYESDDKWVEETQDLSRRIQEDPGLGSRLKGLLDPKSDLGGLAKGHPSYPASAVEKNLPPGIKTLGDLLEVTTKALSAKPKVKPKKNTKDTPSQPLTQPTEKAEAPEEKAVEPKPKTKQEGVNNALPKLPPQLQKLVKELVKLAPGTSQKAEPAPEEASPEEVPKEQVPKGQAETEPSVAPAKGDKKKQKGTKAPKGEPKEEPRRATSATEVAEARQMVMDTFPPKLASIYANLHPDDVRGLISNFKEFKSLGPIPSGDIEAELAKAGKVTLNPDKVPPPKTVTKDGKEVALESLPEEEQTEAIQQHRMAVVGAHLALRSRAISSMKKSGTPPQIAQRVTDFLLSTNGMSPEERQKKAKEKARDLFIAASSDPTVMEVDERFGIPKTHQSWKSSDSKSRTAALSAVKDPAAQALVIAAFQGEDYRQVVKDYFGAGSKNKISDSDSVQVVFDKVKKANEFFRAQSKSYPANVKAGLDDPASLFRVRVRHALSGMNPTKAKKLSKRLAKDDADSYENALKEHHKAEKSYKSRLQQWLAGGQKGPKPMKSEPPAKPLGYVEGEGISDPVSVQTKLDKLMGNKKGSFSSYLTPVCQTQLARLGGEQQDRKGHRGSAAVSQLEETMTIKFAKEDADRILARLDKMAGAIQANHEKWGMNFNTAKALVNDLDRTADEIEKVAFGPASFQDRQVEVLKQAHVIEQDKDEGYMGTFNTPMAPLQTDGDEKYMSQFKDDQSQAVSSGKSSVGRPLAP